MKVATSGLLKVATLGYKFIVGIAMIHHVTAGTSICIRGLVPANVVQ
jgi:hypothetical protein